MKEEDLKTLLLLMFEEIRKNPDITLEEIAGKLRLEKKYRPLCPYYENDECTNEKYWLCPENGGVYGCCQNPNYEGWLR